MAARTPRRADAFTAALAVVLALIAVVELAHTSPTRWGGFALHAPGWAVTAALACVFLLAERALVHIEFRREAYSMSLSGIPLVVGLLVCPPSQLVVARLVGALVAFALERPQRPPLVKVVYNTGAYAFEAASVAFAAHALLPKADHLGLVRALVCYAVIAVVDVVMSLLVVSVISLRRARLGPREIAAVLAPSAVFSGASTGCALIAALLVGSGPLGVVLLGISCVSGAVLYRGYLVRRRRHRSLALIHDFVEQGTGVHTVDEMAARLLGRLKTVLRAEMVELVVATAGDPGAPTVRMVLREDHDLVVHRGPEVSADWLLQAVTTSREPMLVPRGTSEAAMRSWLAARQARDALVVPMPGAGDEVALVVCDREGETTTFTAEDVTLARTLVGHLAVAMHGTRVVDQLRHDANHDALTGLPNRAFLSEQLRRCLEGVGPAAPTAAAGHDGVPALSPGSDCAVLLLDLDRFKDVNDALGHHVGDELLRIVAARLVRAVPVCATVARLGGDEFAVLLPIGDGVAAAHDVVRDISEALAAPVQLSDGVVSTAASIGIAVAAGGLTDSDVLRHADTAMYAAKSLGHPVFYSADLDQGRAERLAMLADLHVALEQDQLELRYQPQLDLATGAVVAVEALVRWRHPRLGLLSPDQFVPLAESTGLIHPLTEVVLRKALRQAREWADDGLDVVVAVNLSARSVDGGLPEKIGAALAEAGLPAHRLILEITESAVMNDPDRAVPALRRVADIGVTLSLDDFGTGYSSLSYLQRLPVQEVKIDRSFVSGLSGPSSSRASTALIHSIVTIGENLGLRVVAEGVEDAETLETLRRMGCDVAQGFHIGRPQTARDVTARLSVTPQALPRQLRSVASS